MTVVSPASRRSLPEALRAAAESWQAQGSPPQPGSRWSLPQWQQALPQHAHFLESLPPVVNRSHVIALCAGAAARPEDAVRGFVAAMVWGYGRVGYGPYRTSRVLAANPQAPEVRRHVAEIAVIRGGVAAFEALKADRLKWLGVAFATQYLFFCAENGQAGPAPVLDRLVRGWLRDNVGSTPRLDWHLRDYQAYVEYVTTWAEELSIKPADVEWLIFDAAANADPASHWGSNKGREQPSSGDEAVLDALDDAAEAFAALEPSPSDADAADFEFGTRVLRRIVLARRQP